MLCSGSNTAVLSVIWSAAFGTVLLVVSNDWDVTNDCVLSVTLIVGNVTDRDESERTLLPLESNPNERTKRNKNKIKISNLGFFRFGFFII